MIIFTITKSNNLKILLVLFLLILALVYSCSASKTPEKARIPLINMKQVKDSLSKWDEIPADSIYVVKLKEQGLYLTQGFGRVDNMIRLVKLYSDRFIVLDSILTFREDDSFGGKKIRYDHKNDWFISEGVGTGSSDVSFSKDLIRVENNRFKHLFSYTKYFYFADPEVIPVTHETVEVKELEMNKKQIVLLTSYQMEYESSSGIHPEFKDTVTFEFSKPQNCFVKKRFTAEAMQEKWSADKGEYLFGV